MHHRPYLVSLLWHSPLIVMQLRQSAIAPFHGRGGPLKGLRPLQGPRLPICQHLGGEPLGDRVLVKVARTASQAACILAFRRRQRVRAT